MLRNGFMERKVLLATAGSEYGELQSWINFTHAR